MTGYNRVRKARRSSALGCGHYVLVGHVIVKRPRGRWICLECALSEIRASHKQATR